MELFFICLKGSNKQKVRCLFGELIRALSPKFSWPFVYVLKALIVSIVLSREIGDVELHVSVTAEEKR